MLSAFTLLLELVVYQNEQDKHYNPYNPSAVEKGE